MQARQLYADHRPWTQRRRRKGTLPAARLDPEGKPRTDLRTYHVNVSQLLFCLFCAWQICCVACGHFRPLCEGIASKPHAPLRAALGVALAHRKHRNTALEMNGACGWQVLVCMSGAGLERTEMALVAACEMDVPAGCTRAVCLVDPCR